VGCRGLSAVAVRGGRRSEYLEAGQIGNGGLSAVIRWMGSEIIGECVGPARFRAEAGQRQGVLVPAAAPAAAE